MKCRDCKAEWGGQKGGHCTRCHRTFSTDKNFDAHLQIEKAPGVYKVIGCNDPLEIRREDGAPRFKERINSRGTAIIVGFESWSPAE